MQKIDRIIARQELEPFFIGVEDFCRDNLPNEVMQLDEESSAKIFADPIQGYVSLAPWEAAIVDTPLFQRLRSIHQLGLTYLVYPTLGYSRFEHTLGVVARLKQLLRHIDENFSSETSSGNTPLTRGNALTSICLAALCHDIGHCVFSHVSEAVMESLQGNTNYPSAKTILDAFMDFAGRRIPIAEAISACIVSSRPFISFIRKLDIHGATSQKGAQELAFNSARLILGLPLLNDPASVYLGQLMSSGLDVDKLDYMLRESHLSGISLGISLEWLMKKLTVRRLGADQVPAGIRSRITDFQPEEQFSVLSLMKGGQFAFEEFCVARLALHEKIYLHQKIRAAEAHMTHRLLGLVQKVDQYAEMHRWLYLRESMLEYPSLEVPTVSLGPLLKKTFADAGEFSISNCRKPYRAYAFGWQNSITEPILDAISRHESDTERFMTAIKNNPEIFRQKINENLQIIRTLLADEELPTGDPEILIDPPRLSSIQQGHDTLHIDHPSRLPIRWTMPIDQISEYYQRNRALGYVFAIKPYLPQVLLACEKAAFDLFKVIYVQDACINQLVVRHANELKEKLHEGGFYSDARSLQPIGSYLSSIKAQTLITNIATRLSKYAPRNKRTVTQASITTYVSQFPLDLQEAALEWLQHIRWIEPEELLRKAFLELSNNPRFSGASRIGLCPLGGLTDSATRISYTIRDLVTQIFSNRAFPRLTLNEALAQNFDAYVLYDDNINSGLQSLNIIASWLGHSGLPSDLDLHEQHVQELQPELKNNLLSKPVAIIFAVGSQGACNSLEQELVNRLGFNENNLCLIAADELPVEQKIFSGPNSPFQHTNKLPLRDLLSKVGETILLAEGKDADKAKRNGLGYHSAEAMIVFEYNCPTMTVTPLWISGEYNGSIWTPLIERSRRLDPVTNAPVGEDS